jgi:hypothetical protein
LSRSSFLLAQAWPGALPFIPTRLRFEDYLLRRYSRSQGFHVGYCDAVQTHRRAMVSRNNIVADLVVEGLATLMKTLINAGLRATAPGAFQFAPCPALDDQDLRTLWGQLVAPLTRQEGAGAGRRSPYWQFYQALVREEALDLMDPGPFVARHRQRLRTAYQESLDGRDLVAIGSLLRNRSYRLTLAGPDAIAVRSG